jgi:hypothetical protein
VPAPTATATAELRHTTAAAAPNHNLLERLNTVPPQRTATAAIGRRLQIDNI